MTNRCVKSVFYSLHTSMRSNFLKVSAQFNPHYAPQFSPTHILTYGTLRTINNNLRYGTRRCDVPWGWRARCTRSTRRRLPWCRVGSACCRASATPGDCLVETFVILVDEIMSLVCREWFWDNVAGWWLLYLFTSILRATSPEIKIPISYLMLCAFSVLPSIRRHQGTV